MEEQLFEWDAFDFAGAADFMFYDCTFKTDVGPYKKGDQADLIALLYTEGKIDVFEQEDATEPDWQGDLLLEVAEREDE